MLARGLMADAIGNLLTAQPHIDAWLAASRLTFDLSTADEKKASQHAKPPKQMSRP